MTKNQRLAYISVFNVDGKRLKGRVDVNLTGPTDDIDAQTRVELPQWLCAKIYDLVYAEYAANCGPDKLNAKREIKE